MWQIVGYIDDNVYAKHLKELNLGLKFKDSHTLKTSIGDVVFITGRYWFGSAEIESSLNKFMWIYFNGIEVLAYIPFMIRDMKWKQIK